MNYYILFKYLHLVAIITMIACLAAELVLLKKVMHRHEIKRVARVDSLYGVAAIIAVAAGLTLWFGVGKGSAFYNNPVLHVKVTLVVIVGLISIAPTIYFIRTSKGEQTEKIEVQQRIRKMVSLQLIILALVPLLATMMANGHRF